jgi:hypothetical protein
MKPAPKWLKAEIEEQFFAGLAAKLKANAPLTRDECDVLLDHLKRQPKRGVGRPTDELKPGAAWWLGLACIMGEIKGEPTKAVVDDIARKNNVSIRTVYAARKRLLCK